MAIQGGILEQKEIGLPIGLSGTHYNTEIDSITGLLRLKVIEYDTSDSPIYAQEGYWISDVIDLGDIFLDFEKVFATQVNSGSSNASILTRVSENGVDWSEWLAVSYDGTIQSETKQYIQVKINLYAGFVNEKYNINLNEYITENDYIESNNNLKLKREYQYNMVIDDSWVEDGSIHRKLITRQNWLRIDKVNIESVME